MVRGPAGERGPTPPMIDCRGVGRESRVADRTCRPPAHILPLNLLFFFLSGRKESLLGDTLSQVACLGEHVIAGVRCMGSQITVLPDSVIC